MFLPAKLDIRRLEDVTHRLQKGDYFHRGEGKTLAYIYMMLAEIDLGDQTNRYLYVGENEAIARYVALDFLTLIEEILPGYFSKVDSYNWSPTMIIVKGQVFHFMGAHEFAKGGRLEGYRFDRVFFDVTSDLQFRLDKDGELITTMSRLEERGADFI